MNMDDSQDQILQEVQKLQATIAEYEQISKILIKQKEQLSKYATQIQNSRTNNEKNSMFFEDSLAKTPQIIKDYMKNADPSIPKDQSFQLLQEIQQKYRNSLKPRENADKLRQNINEMMIKMTEQQQQLQEEEAIINSLRNQEIALKKENDFQYESIMEKVRQKSDEFQILRKENKAKKLVLIKYQEKSNKIQENISNTQALIDKLCKEINQETTKNSNLQEEFKKLQIQSNSFEEKQKKRIKIQKEIDYLHNEEEELENDLNQLKADYIEKVKAVQNLLSQAESYEYELSEITNISDQLENTESS